MYSSTNLQIYLKRLKPMTDELRRKSVVSLTGGVHKHFQRSIQLCDKTLYSGKGYIGHIQNVHKKGKLYLFRTSVKQTVNVSFFHYRVLTS